LAVEVVFSGNASSPFYPVASFSHAQPPHSQNYVDLSGNSGLHRANSFFGFTSFCHGKVLSTRPARSSLTQIFERLQLDDSAANKWSEKTCNIAEKLEDDGKNLVIFWGPHSETVEEFAN
jgi:hypothetical protein